jgi:hypothetical protein
MADLNRLVQVKDLDRKKEGSGYLIAPNLVVTAWHVVRPARSALIRTYGSFRRGTGINRYKLIPAEVIWPPDGQETEEGFDFALLRVEGQAADPIFYSSLPDTGEIKVTALGFPDANKFRNRFLTAFGIGSTDERDTREVAGWVSAGTDFGRRTIYGGGFDVVIAAENLPEGSKEGWSGMSGGPVFTGHRFLGVITTAKEIRSYHRLSALPVDRLFQLPDVIQAIRRAGLVAPQFSPVDEDRLRFDPATFLHLLDRKDLCDKIMARLDEWDRGSRAPLLLSVRGWAVDELEKLSRRLSEEELFKLPVKSITWPADADETQLKWTLKTEFAAASTTPKAIAESLAGTDGVFVTTEISAKFLVADPAHRALLEWWRLFWTEAAQLGAQVALLLIVVEDAPLLPCCNPPMRECSGSCEATVNARTAPPPWALNEAWTRLPPPSLVVHKDLDPWIDRLKRMQPHLREAIEAVGNELDREFDAYLPRGMRCIKQGLPTFLGELNGRQ